jgi:hypothetical protein
MWRISNDSAEPSLIFSTIEIRVFNCKFKKQKPKYLSDYILLLAKLGGYIGRSSDPPPGNKIIWRGYNKLNELCEGFMLAI